MQISLPQATILFILITLVFLLAPLSILLFIRLYNTRKKQHIDEKLQMKRNFDAEIQTTTMEVKEHTLNTIGADLHDNIGQLLSLTNLTLNSIDFSNSTKARQKVHDVVELTRRSIKELGQLAQLLNGDTLTGNNLVKAIEAELSWMAKTETLNIISQPMPDLQSGSPDKDIVIFRLFQEAINNIIKHAQATVITISLSFHDGVLHMTVTDNGTGFDQYEVAARTGQGLKNMFKRATLIGGEALLKSIRGEGTIVTVTVPYP